MDSALLKAALAAVLLAGVLSSSLQAQTILHVNPSATGAGDGTSWSDAYTNLQDALAAAGSGDQVWVAQGSYRTDEGSGFQSGDRSATFQLRDGVQLFGGFAGIETQIAERDPERFKTFLTGDLSGDDAPGFAFREDNAYHVVTASGVGNTTLLEGFYITGGYAFGSDADSVGGGMLVLDGSPSVINTVFVSNAAACGGGMYSSGQAPEIINSVFTGNEANSGGALCNVDSNPTVVNATVVSNYALRGAAVFNLDSSPVIINSILARNSSPTNFLECQRGGYPCTFAEMDPEVIERSTTMSDEARERVESESPEAAVSWLRSQEDVVFAEGDTAAVMFRIEGGPQTWILIESGQSIETQGKKAPTPNSSIQPFVHRSQTNPVSELRFVDVVGRDTNGDGKRNNRDRKKVLILGPFRFQYAAEPSPDVRNVFEMAEAYSGGISYFVNEEAGVDKFKNWQEYDIVSLITHGKRTCKEKKCRTLLASGTEVDVPEMNQSLDPGLSIVNIRRTDDRSIPPLHFVALETDFFRWNYPNGLDRMIVMINGCQTGTPTDKRTIPDLPDNLLAGAWNHAQTSAATSLYLGWTGTVEASQILNASTRFFSDVASRGLRARVAMRELKAAGLGIGVPPLVNTELVIIFKTGTDLYGREIVSLRDPSGAKLLDEAVINSYLEGTAGDGLIDDLRISARVEGVDEETKGQFQISFELDGRSLAAPIALTDVDALVPLDGVPHAYAISHRLSAGTDMKTSVSYSLEAIIHMPGGGQSRYEASDLTIVGGCHWVLNIGGTRAGRYSGRDVTFVEQVGQFSILSPEVPSFQIFLSSPPPTGPSGPYEIAAEAAGDGNAVISFVGLFSDPPLLYSTGDGSDLRNANGDVIFTLPNASGMSIRRFDGDTIDGMLSGTAWAQTNFDPFNPGFESVPFSLEFIGKNGQNPDGSLRSDACSGES